MTGITCAVAGSGSYIASTTVTVGFYSNPPSTVATYGFADYVGGSVSPSTWNGRNLLEILWEDTLLSGKQVVFVVAGSLPNSGWTTMTIDGNVYNRVDATYTLGSNTNWTWSSVTNPFGTTVGATKTVTWI